MRSAWGEESVSNWETRAACRKSTGIWGGVDRGYEPSKKPEPEVREQLRRVAEGV